MVTKAKKTPHKGACSYAISFERGRLPVFLLNGFGRVRWGMSVFAHHRPGRVLRFLDGSSSVEDLSGIYSQEEVERAIAPTDKCV